MFNNIGRDAFFEELYKIDVVSAQTLHKNNTQRILRAYDVASFTGKPMSYWWSERRKHKHDNVLSFTLLHEKNILHERCYDRILEMIKNGAIEEVFDFSSRYPNYNGPLRNTIGYREIIENVGSDYHCKDATQRAMINNYVINSMYIRIKQYIKRQSTWFRNQMRSSIVLHGLNNQERIIEHIAEFLQFCGKE
jgi:tRNA dimethylallyltransferase